MRAPPAWASAGGEDRFGPWAMLTVAGVHQRLRWIPPGPFTQGSPEAEVGRFDTEGPARPVTLTAGLWLGETPVTQALWQAVMGDNPSRFPDPRRPVEQVSWDDAQRMLARLRAAHGCPAALPTEAQWEAACRAGTRTATWADDLTLQADPDGGEARAPVLDPIAWHLGNSAQGFDHPNGHGLLDGRVAGTRAVGLKPPNPWGLYDMLGNVWEWCQDPWQDTYEGLADVDPMGAARGPLRVVRGGSWLHPPRMIRAAARSAHPRAGRNLTVGLRLAVPATA
ncbi:MAG: formylglycine-generating enzyme family protein [Myxococcales bacterium]|nr:formylglycine-generating enzyme family protein [Myxococcales bacterium]